MNIYELSREAFGDLEEILIFREEHAGGEAAHLLETKLVTAFQRLADSPGLGHRRSDLTARPLYFYTVEPYLILYARGIEPLPIISVLHSSRNIKRLLRSRYKR